MEEAEKGRAAPANGTANEENGDQEVDNEGNGNLGGGECGRGREWEVMTMRTLKQLWANEQLNEDHEDDDADTKKQKTDQDD